MDPSVDTELEWQLDAHDLRPVRQWIETSAPVRGKGVSIGQGRSVTQVDTYLDTDDRRLDRAGYSVRLRQTRRSAPVATLKSVAPNGHDVGGLLVRLELEESLDVDDPSAVASGAGPVGERVRALVGSQRVVPLFEVHTRRRILPLAADGETLGELALDDTAIRAPGGRIISRLRRIEVEAPAEKRLQVEPFVNELRVACGLQPALLSKYESGLVATGFQRPEPATFGATAISPSDRIGELALAVLRRQFSAMLAKEPGTRLGDDVEELHDMRVASRRMRAALSLFSDTLPAAATGLREELAWVGREIGVVRDLDVQLQRLDAVIEALPESSREPLGVLRSLLVQERLDARRQMLAALDSPRYARFVRRFGALLRTRSGTRTPPALEAAPDLLERRYRSVRKAARRIGPDAEPEAYHRLRIAGKRLRYALEFLSPVYPGATKRLIRRTVAVQDLLGAYQDAGVAIDRLRTLAAERGVELGPATTFAMGELAERYRREMEDIRIQTPKPFVRLDGKDWKELRKHMEAAGPAAS